MIPKSILADSAVERSASYAGERLFIAQGLNAHTIVRMIPRDKRTPIDLSFDTDLAERLARYETYNKHHYRPNTYLHKWWGRRCGSTFRLILKGLVDDESGRSYYCPGGLAGKVILDPMMGGGTTLHEAIRLGASVIGADVDPIPVLQARATLTERPEAALEAGFHSLYGALTQSLSDLYRTHCPHCDEPAPLWYALYGLRRRCSCREVLVVDSLTVRHEPDGSVLCWCARCGELHSDGRHRCRGGDVALVEKEVLVCERCDTGFHDLVERPYFGRYEMLAVAGHCEAHGLFHKTADWRDHQLKARADERRAGLPFDPDAFCVEAGDKSIQLLRRQIFSYLDLFSSRQLIFLSLVAQALPEDDPIVRLNLALLVSTSLEFNSLLCGFKGIHKRRAGAVRHTFAHHGYSFPYTALENNPIYPRRASGTLQKLFSSRIVRGRRWAAAPKERRFDDGKSPFVVIGGESDSGVEVGTAKELSEAGRRFLLMQRSSTKLPLETASIDAVVTDPPYYDSIQYGDLAAFFRVWLRLFLPNEADWSYDVSTAAVSSEREGDAGHYVGSMTAIFRECRRVLVPGRGRLIFTFHHWQPRAWAALSTALFDAGFVMLNRYVVHAEHPMSVHISKMKALTHDAIFVLAPREDPYRARWETPSTIEPRDSYQFTEGCATLMGWILDQNGLTSGEIEHYWEQALVSSGGR